MRLSSLISNLDATKISRMFVFCYVAGYFSARVFSIFVDEGISGASDFIVKFVSLGPMTFYGGAIGCFLCGLMYSRIKGLNLKDVVDVSFPAGLAALSIGRIGCFLNGDDYGKLTAGQGGDAPWYAVVFPNLQDGASRFPVQLMSSLVAGIVAVYFIKNFNSVRGKFGAGAVGIYSVLAYAIGRFGLEYFRGDPRGEVFEGMLSTSQFISVLVAGTCFLYAAKLRKVS